LFDPSLVGIDVAGTRSQEQTMTDDASASALVAKREAMPAEASLRPQLLREFIGQEQARSPQGVIERQGAAEALDTCVRGPPGLGKTTLAQIMARELGVGFRSTSGPVIAKAGPGRAAHQLGTATSFIDEIHRLNPAVEEILYPAMEDYQLDLIIARAGGALGQDQLSRFTLIGATTRTGLLTTAAARPLRHPGAVNFYTHAELE